jgi:hypothetical protein
LLILVRPVQVRTEELSLIGGGFIMYEWLGWVFVCAGGLIVLIEVAIYLVKSFKQPKAPKAPKMAIPDAIVIELIKKLPWMVILGLILIYLGLYIIGVPIPFSIAI